MYFFFFFNDTATTEIYTLSLHDALPISVVFSVMNGLILRALNVPQALSLYIIEDRKSTRLNSSHTVISYAVFCLKKKKYEQFAMGRCMEKYDFQLTRHLYDLHLFQVGSS